MALVDQVEAFADRIATEFNSIRTALAGKAATVHTHTSSQLTDRATLIGDAVDAARAELIVVNPVSTTGLPDGTLIARTE